MGQPDNVGYDFNKQLQIETEFTPLIMEFLRVFTGTEPKDVRNQCLPYDFEADGKTYDLKADCWIGKTDNFFIETESVKGKKKGWLYNNTDFILYLDTVYLVLYILETEKLRQIEDKITQWKYHEISQNSNYLTCGHVVPIHVLRKHFPIKKFMLRYFLPNFVTGRNVTAWKAKP